MPGQPGPQQLRGVGSEPIKATLLFVSGITSSAALLFGLLGILIFAFFSIQSLFFDFSTAQQLVYIVPCIVELLIASAFLFVGIMCFTTAYKTRWTSASATWAVFTGIGACVFSLIWLLLFVEEVFNAFSNIVFDSLFFSLTLALSLALVAAVFFALGAIKAKKTFFVSTKVGLIAAILLVFFAVFLLLFGLIGEPLIYEWFALSAQNYELRALLEILSFMFVFLPLIAFSVCLAVFLASIARQLSRGSYRLHPLFISETPQ